MDDLHKRLANITLLLMDCDGVLTDGRLYYTEKGEVMKVFDVKDGQGLALWHAAGFQSGIITGRPGLGIVEQRATELGMHYVRDGSKNKVADLASILQAASLTADSVAYIGDDIGDIEVMRSVAFSFAVADSVKVVQDNADRVLSFNGGRGAVREAIDLLLAAKAAA